MKRLLTVVLAIALTLAATMTCFADTSGDAVQIKATVPATSYTINIPSNVEITDADHAFKVIGAASVKDVVHVSNSQVISYVATGTDFTDSDSNTMAATYYTSTADNPEKDGSTSFTEKKTAAIAVFENGEVVNPLTKICVGIADDVWKNAPAGEYTATLTYEFSVSDAQ